MTDITIFHFSGAFFYWRKKGKYSDGGNEIKKGKYSDGVQIFPFFSSIDLFDVKDSKRNLTNDNLIRNVFWREFDVVVFMVRWISLGNGFWVVSTWRAPVRKPKTTQTINFKLCLRISNKLLHKTVLAVFLTMSYLFL